jgi:DMSO/TMAO reductase YedYZ molybdopterin-dependent catalytic subunit
VTRNRDFYRVDTALTVPQLTTDAWQLRISGRVQHPTTLTYGDLLDRPLIERYITMTCVSDAVGGPYVSTAKFLGAPLAPLLREVGVHPSADQIVGTSVDGMTIGTPTAVVMDGRDAMLAIAMNDEPLPLEHGFPCRMLVPGLYGYVSATKWLIGLEATTFADRQTYWVKRTWAPRAPVRLQSRIDTPHGLSTLRRGDRVMIAGVAWHQRVGVRGVQVRIDGGPWQDADLGRVPSADTWVQWSLPWRVAGGGPVTLQVRAIDRAGRVQDEHRRGVFPSGATGWHSIVVTVG